MQRVAAGQIAARQVGYGQGTVVAPLVSMNSTFCSWAQVRARWATERHSVSDSPELVEPVVLRNRYHRIELARTPEMLPHLEGIRIWSDS